MFNMLLVTPIVVLIWLVASAILATESVPQQQQQQRQQNQKQQQQPKKRRPNILLLITDDQDLLLGSTNHMKFFHQHLTKQGTTIANFFVHTPICCPSRSTILTGQYLHNNGVRNNSFQGNCNGLAWKRLQELQTFAVYAKQAGYRTAFFGKYLNTYGLNAVKEPHRVPPGWNRWLGIVGTGSYHGTTTTTTPFLIVVSWPTPHGPFTPAPWASHMFNTSIAPRTPNWNASAVYMQQKHWIMRKQGPIDAEAVVKIDTSYRRRLQSLQSVDRHIDAFIKALTKQKVLNNTIIMYTSDNGFQSGQHRLGGDKRHLYEHDIRVPFVIRGPNIPKNATIAHQVFGNIDIAPTIYYIIHNTNISTTSVALPNNMDGISMLPIILRQRNRRLAVGGGNPAAARHDMLISYFGEGYLPCKLMVCPPDPPNDFHIIDSTNNTFHCIRSVLPPANFFVNSTIKNTLWTNFTYCRFEDDEKFGEYYDHTKDPWQLRNTFSKLSTVKRVQLDRRLMQLRNCRGSGCRRS